MRDFSLSCLTKPQSLAYRIFLQRVWWCWLTCVDWWEIRGTSFFYTLLISEEPKWPNATKTGQGPRSEEGDMYHPCDMWHGVLVAQYLIVPQVYPLLPQGALSLRLSSDSFHHHHFLSLTDMKENVRSRLRVYLVLRLKENASGRMIGKRPF